jgi:hypothetical protein
MPHSTSPVSPRALRIARLSLILVAALLIGSAPATAASAPSIEGVWSFTGGEVAIQRQPDGSFTGTVVQPTRFAECSHPIGETMWTAMHAQPDGSFWGLHEWFFENAGCAVNPTPGPTAWRVLQTATGGRFLRACFSTPGTGQPTIAASGASANVSYGCVDSAQSSPPPSTSGAAGFRSAVSLPSARKCFSRRLLRIHLHDPSNDPLKEVVVTLKGRRLRVLRHGNAFTSTIDLRGLPKGAFTVRIRLSTVLGHHLHGSRTYRTCVKRRRVSTPQR